MPPSRTRDGGFDEYRHLIMETLERLQRGITAIDVKVDALRNQEVEALKIDVAMLKVRASLWGALAGCVGGAVVGVLVTKVLG